MNKRSIRPVAAQSEEGLNKGLLHKLLVCARLARKPQQSPRHLVLIPPDDSFKRFFVAAARLPYVLFVAIERRTLRLLDWVGIVRRVQRKHVAAPLYPGDEPGLQAGAERE